MDVEQVTTPTEKTKAPGRVAYVAKTRHQKTSKQVEPTHTESSVATQTLIGIGCLALGAGALYYQYRTYWRNPPQPTPVAHVIDKAKDDKVIPKSRLADLR